MVRGVLKLVLLLAFVFGATFATMAQNAAVNGTVTDSSGAVVAHAKISVRNVDTNIVRDTESSDSGTYSVPNLPPGKYEVTVGKSGLKTIQFSAVTITVDQTLTLDAKLDVSPVSQTVTVTSEAVAPIDTTDDQISTMVDKREIQELPLILRDPYQLVLLTPGAVQTNSGLGGFSINGARERNNNFQLDGVDNNDPGVPGGTGLAALNPDATQEFRVITNNYLPEFGRNSGAVIDIVTRSGTNDLHGDVYWFGRYNALGARDFFNTPPARKDPYVRNDFGASIGGPIKHNKAFFFFNYEGQRFATTLQNVANVPNQAFRTGVFQFVDQFDPAHPVDNFDISTPGSFSNVNGLSQDPLAQKLLALYPLPTPGTPAIDGARGILQFPSPDLFTGDNYTAKVDYNISQKNVLSVRYIGSPATDSNQGHNDTLPGIGAISSNGLTQSLSAHLTSTLSQSWVNDLRASAVRSSAQFTCNGTQQLNAVFGTDQFGRGRDFANIDGLAPIGCIALGDTDAQSRPFGTYNIGDTATWVKGRHTMRFGI
jgi:Carboxypeptidase regulatory-like domain